MSREAETTATDYLDSNMRETRAIPEGKGNANGLQHECGTKSFGREEDLGRPKGIVFKKDDVSRKVRRFYLVKFWPYNDPEEQSKIKRAEKFIKKMDQESIPVLESYRRNWSHETRAYSQLDRLRRRRRILDYAASWKQEKLDHLQAVLQDKLNVANNFNLRSNQRVRALLHKNTNLATEKKLLQEIPASRSQQEQDDDFGCDSTYYFMEKLNEFIQWFYGQRQGNNNNGTSYKKFLKQMKHLEEKMASIPEGRVWDPWTERNIIQDQINLLKSWKLAEEIKSEEAELIAEIERVQRELKPVRKEAAELYQQLNDIKQRNEEAEKCIQNLRKRHEEENVRYCEYLSIVSIARELARKKDAAALEELSRVEVEKFMSRWNKSKAFRSSYVKRVLPSLNNRQLCGDGQIRNHDEEG